MTAWVRLAATCMLPFLIAACSGNTESTTAEDDAVSTKRFTSLKAPADKDLAALYAAGSKVENSYIGVYRFNAPSNEGKDATARANRIKEVMHRYMCRYFDESIDISRPGTSVSAAVSVFDSDAHAKAFAGFQKALGPVLNDKGLDTVVGTASGNNTVGEVLGVYDTTHNEILFFGFTNCGSDD